MELEDLPLDVGELGVIISLLGLGIAFLLYKQLSGKNVENETVASIGDKIQSGAMAFLNAEYSVPSSKLSISPPTGKPCASLETLTLVFLRLSCK